MILCFRIFRFCKILLLLLQHKVGKLCQEALMTHSNLIDNFAENVDLCCRLMLMFSGHA